MDDGKIVLRVDGRNKKRKGIPGTHSQLRLRILVTTTPLRLSLDYIYKASINLSPFQPKVAPVVPVIPSLPHYPITSFLHYFITFYPVTLSPCYLVPSLLHYCMTRDEKIVNRYWDHHFFAIFGGSNHQNDLYCS